MAPLITLVLLVQYTHQTQLSHFIIHCFARHSLSAMLHAFNILTRFRTGLLSTPACFSQPAQYVSFAAAPFAAATQYLPVSCSTFHAHLLSLKTAHRLP